MESDLIYTELNKRGGYVSPVEMFVTTIKINNRQTLSLIAWSFTSEGLIAWFTWLDMEFQSEKVCVTGMKRLLCSNSLCYGA